MKINEMEEKMDNMKHYLKNDIKQTMKRSLGNLNAHIVHLAGGRPVNEQELEACLKLKANKVETESLRETKATKIELEGAVEMVKGLEVQLKDAIILFMECVKDNIFPENGIKNKVINKNASMFHQLKTIYNWVHHERQASPMTLSVKKEEKSRSTVLPNSANNLFNQRIDLQKMKKVSLRLLFVGSKLK